MAQNLSDLVAGRVERTVRKSDVSIGIISDRPGPPTAQYSIGAFGEVVWIRTPRDPYHVRRDGDGSPVTGDASEDQSVDMVFIETDSMQVPAGAEDSLDAELVVQVSRREKGRDSGRPEARPGWSVVGHYSLPHHKVGGVSDGEFNVTVCCKGKSKDLPLFLPRSVPNLLGDVLSGVETGSCCEKPSPGQPNSACGLIALNDVGGTEVVTPYVKMQDQFVKRKLTKEEMARVIDLPETTLVRMTDLELSDLMSHVVPGKVVGAVIHFFVGNDARAEKTGTESKPRPDGHYSPHYQEWWKQDDEETVEVDLIEFESKGGEPSDKATKADDAEVPVHLWNERILEAVLDGRSAIERETGAKTGWDLTSGEGKKALLDLLSALRKCALRYWKRKLSRDFHQWWVKQKKRIAPKEQREVHFAGRTAIERASYSSWWEWTKGSTIFFWRWPTHYQKLARLGVPPMFDEDPPKSEGPAAAIS